MIDRCDLGPDDTIFIPSLSGWYTVRYVRTIADARGFDMEVVFHANSQNGTEEFSMRFDSSREPFIKGGI